MHAHKMPVTPGQSPVHRLASASASVSALASYDLTCRAHSRPPSSEQQSVLQRERREAERQYAGNVARELLLFESSTTTSVVDVGGGACGSSPTPSSAAAVSASTAEEDAKKQEVLVNHPWFEALLEKHKDAMTARGITNGCGSGEGGGNIGVKIARYLNS